jgi:hypothetical protein
MPQKIMFVTFVHINVYTYRESKRGKERDVNNIFTLNFKRMLNGLLVKFVPTSV